MQQVQAPQHLDAADPRAVQPRIGVEKPDWPMLALALDDVQDHFSVTARAD